MGIESIYTIDDDLSYFIKYFKKCIVITVLYQ